MRALLVSCLIALATLCASGKLFANADTDAQHGVVLYRCRKVDYTRLVRVRNCSPFNFTTNACRGFCKSYSIPTAEDVGVAAERAHTGEIENRSAVSDLKSVFNFAGRVSRRRRRRRRRSRQLLRGRRSAEEVPDYVVGDINDRTSAIQRFPRQMRSRSFSSSLGFVAPEAEGRETSDLDWQPHNLDNHQRSVRDISLVGLPVRDASPAVRDIVSVSQCCAMTDFEMLIHFAECDEGVRVLSFKSAKSCECDICKQSF